MKVYYKDSSIHIEQVGKFFPKTLEAHISGTKIEIKYIESESISEVVRLEFTEIEDLNGNQVSSDPTIVVDYLNTEFNKSPRDWNLIEW